MNIAICDDEQDSREELLRLCRQYGHGLNILCYSTASALLSDTEMRVDIILMDIEMEAPNGFEAAKALRRKKNPPLIIFVTKSSAYTIQGYGVAFRYLPKPISYEALADALNLAIKAIEPTKISFISGGTSYVVPIDTIVYCESLDHVLTIHTFSEDLSSRISLQELSEKLSGEAFAQPHKSYLVNLAFVNRVEPGCLYLKYGGNSARIPMSKGKRKEFMQSLGEYIAR